MNSNAKLGIKDDLENNPTQTFEDLLENTNLEKSKNSFRGILDILQMILKELVSFLKHSAGGLVTFEFLKLAIPLLVLWEILPRTGIVSRNLMPALSDVFMSFFDLLLHKNLFGHVIDSMSTFFLGLIIAVIIAVPLGIIVGWNEFIRKHILPLFQILAPIPPTAWVPITIVILGIGLPMKIFLIFLGAFYPIFLNTYQAVKDTDPRYISSARAFGASEFYLIIHVYFWHAFGAIIMSIKTGIALGLVVLTAAEMYGSKSGIGFLLNQAKEFFQIPVMVVCMLILGWIGWFLIEILKHVELRISLWKEVR